MAYAAARAAPGIYPRRQRVGPCYGQTQNAPHVDLTAMTVNCSPPFRIWRNSGTFGRSVPLIARILYPQPISDPLPTTNDEIVLRKLSIVDILQKSSMIICLWNRFRPAPLPPVKHSPTTSPRARPVARCVFLSTAAPRHEVKCNRLTVPADIEQPTNVILLTDASGRVFLHLL